MSELLFAAHPEEGLSLSKARLEGPRTNAELSYTAGF
jgi:hypothetical protein